ncbi:hypothetical protein [Streptomyces sp. NPDC090022]|uniref:hypothetical protein n=1 Tax=Streptomyces sp. NPDC090022 TaxID=3365920 RepID=UPI0038090380
MLSSAPAATAAPSPSPTPTPTGTAPGSPAPAPAATRADQRLVTVTRSGGFAGKQRSLLVKGDGSWTRLDGRARTVGEGRLSGAGLGRLRTALRDAGFATLPRTLLGGRPVFDGCTWAFVHDGHEVVADSAGIPVRLRAVLDALPSFATAQEPVRRHR